MSVKNNLVGRKIVIVEVSRRGPCHYWDFESKVFATLKRAEKWIDEQIDALVKEYDLDKGKAVDGWHVDIDGDSAVQFDPQEDYIY